MKHFIAAILLGTCLLTTLANFAEDSGHWWDKFKPNVNGKSPFKAKPYVKPPDPTTTKMWYYDHNDSQKKCLTWSEAVALHLPKSAALKSCEGENAPEY